MSDADEQRQRWVVQNWVWIGVTIGVMLFLVSVGIAIWLGILDAAVPTDGQESAPWSTFVVVLAVLALAAWMLKRAL